MEQPEERARVALQHEELQEARRCLGLKEVEMAEASAAMADITREAEAQAQAQEEEAAQMGMEVAALQEEREQLQELWRMAHSSLDHEQGCQAAQMLELRQHEHTMERLQAQLEHSQATNLVLESEVADKTAEAEDAGAQMLETEQRLLQLVAEMQTKSKEVDERDAAMEESALEAQASATKARKAVECASRQQGDLVRMELEAINLRQELHVSQQRLVGMSAQAEKQSQFAQQLDAQLRTKHAEGEAAIHGREELEAQLAEGAAEMEKLRVQLHEEEQRTAGQWAELEAECAAVQTSMEAECAEAVVRAEEECANAETRVQEAEAQAEREREEVETQGARMRQQLKTLETQLAENGTAVMKLRMQVHSQEAAAALEVGQRDATVAELETRLLEQAQRAQEKGAAAADERRAELERLSAEAEAQHEEVRARLEATCAQLRRQCEESEVELEHRGSAVGALQKLLQQQQAAAEAREAEKESDFELRCAELARQVDQREAKYGVAEAQAEQMAARMREWEAEAEAHQRQRERRAEAEVTERERETLELSSALVRVQWDAETAGAEMAERLEAAETLLREHKQVAEAQLAEASKAATKLRTQFGEHRRLAKHELSEVRELAEEMRRGQTELVQAQGEALEAKLRMQLAEQERVATAALEQESQQIRELQAQSETLLASAKSEHHKALSSVKLELKQTYCHVAQMQQQVTGLQEEMATRDGLRKDDDSKHEVLAERLREAEEEAGVTSEAIGELQHELQVRYEHAEGLEEALAATEARLLTVSFDFQSHAHETEAMEKTMQSMHSQVAEDNAFLTTQVEQLEAALLHEKMEVVKVEEQGLARVEEVHAMRKELEESSSQVGDLRAQLAMKEGVARRLEAVLSEESQALAMTKAKLEEVESTAAMAASDWQRGLQVAEADCQLSTWQAQAAQHNLEEMVTELQEEVLVRQKQVEELRGEVQKGSAAAAQNASKLQDAQRQQHDLRARAKAGLDQAVAQCTSRHEMQTQKLKAELMKSQHQVAQLERDLKAKLEAMQRMEEQELKKVTDEYRNIVAIYREDLADMLPVRRESDKAEEV
ncbi:hypothetical protein CYMTET_39280 [Cymbomonas tetramitiformis]|uniref:Uncharacterized protein n=1 Tax=Cymbomonas tetramitiformis TaxID=36881 RepID=A0AAE0F433_9CHLO|nr:hypothetical protein CYMTET_39280 [Cymbomonas tetramitiformis]